MEANLIRPSPFLLDGGCLAHSGLPVTHAPTIGGVEQTVNPYSRPFIEQACSVSLGDWLRFFWRIYGRHVRVFDSVQKQAKKEFGQYSATLTEQTW